MKNAASVLLAMVASIVGTAPRAAEPLALRIRADDGFQLAASYFDPGKSGPGILLLHQCNRDRSMWESLAHGLSQAGFHVLALDYRGYGDSRNEGVDIEGADPDARSRIHAFAPQDVRAAWRKLVSIEGVDRSKIGTGGASCGGPRSVELAAQEAGVRTMLFLSTYLSDDAIETFDRKLKGLPILAITAEKDGRTTDSLRELFRRSEHPQSRLVLYKGEEHGFPLFRQDPRLESTIVDWYRDHLQ